MNHLTISQRVILHTLLIAGSIMMLLPFLWMLSTSLKPYVETLQYPPALLPSEWKFSNYLEVIQEPGKNFGRYYLNTFLITVIKTVAQFFFCSMAAYAIATVDFPGKNVIFIGILSVMMIPMQVMLVPTYVLIRELGWLDTYAALTVPGAAGAFGIFLLRQFFMSIPKELNEAAKIDGCSFLRIYWNIYLPLSKTALVSLSIFVIMASWNDFINPLILTNTEQMRTLSLGIASHVGEYEINYSLMLAASCMAILPLILTFIFFQRYFIEGIALTGVKG